MSSDNCVLIYADDDTLVREALATSLEASGVVVRQCENGLEAIDLCREIHPATMLLDINMPVLDGYETACRVRADPNIAGTRLIAISGGCDRDASTRAKDAGFDVVLRKPVSMANLLKTVLETP
jgi:CheY-like chemotaxis protein